MKICILTPQVNEPFRYAHVLAKSFRKLGHDVESIPFRGVSQKRIEAKLLGVDADLMIVLRGDGISADVIESISCKTVLWHGENTIGDSPAAHTARNQLSQNIKAFDQVVSFGNDGETELIQMLKDLGGKNVTNCYPCRFNPDIYKDLDLPKLYDVTFIGTVTPRRMEIFNALNREFDVKFVNIWNVGEQVIFHNQSKIALHVTAFDFQLKSTINMRAFDIIGCGTFHLAEGKISGDQFTHGEHLAYWEFGNIGELIKDIQHYLAWDKTRENIATAGREHLIKNYSALKTAAEFLEKVK